MPTVSVIIPSYNHAAYLPEAIGSVLAQTYKDFDVLVADDGSTDATRDAVKPYLSRIRFHALPHAGIAATYNRGVALAKGELLAFLESDDTWAPTYLERALSALEAEKKICGVTVCREIISSGKAGTDKPLGLVKKRSKGKFFTPESILTGGDWGMVATPVLRRKCLEKVGPFNESLDFGCDVDFALRFCLKHKLAYVDEPLYLYRRHPGNTTRDAVATACEALRVALHFVESQPEYARAHADVVNRCVGNLYGRYGSLMLKTGNHTRREILDAFRTAIRYHPRLKHYRRLVLASVLPRAFFRLLGRR